jgi:hypothetical protein
MLNVVLVTKMVTFFFGLPLPPTTTVVCFKWVLIRCSIVLYMLLHNLHSACYCSGGGNHFLGLPIIIAINAMFLSYIWF